MGDVERLTSLIVAWCEAQREWDNDLQGTKTPPMQGAGFPKIVTRENLHYAGRDLYEVANLEPHTFGVYANNNFITKRDKK